MNNLTNLSVVRLGAFMETSCNKKGILVIIDSKNHRKVTR